MRWTTCALVLGLACAGTARAQDLKLTGTVVAPDKVLDSALVSVTRGRISGVVEGGTDKDAVATDGVIFPGLIDLHNHLTWNVLPNWTPPRLFTNRYEWQELPEYVTRLSGPYAALATPDRLCDMNRFGEIKSLVNGGTVTVGGYGPTKAAPERNTCILGLARNADNAADLLAKPALNQEPYRNFVFPFEPFEEDDEQRVRTVDPKSTDPKILHAAVVHLAEGTDAAARREFRLFKTHGFIRKGVSVIHAVALAPEQIRELAKGGVGLVWSPHSNFILYGKTADVLTAVDANMTIAIAPDWSPSGSAGMIEELGVAYRYSAAALNNAITPAMLVDMATINPARLAKLDRDLGSIETGKLADLLVMKRRDKTASAYRALLHATPGDVQLVTVGGVPIYGDRDLMKKLLPRGPLEDIYICGEPKALHVVDAATSADTWQHVYARLAEAMRPLGMAPSPLANCSLP